MRAYAPFFFCILYLTILALSVYSWRDWYGALCGLIVLMAFLDHPYMPRSVMGIQGLNPWNALLLVVLLSWLANRRRERLFWDMPPTVNVLLLAYLAVFLLAFFRMILDRSAMITYGYTVKDLISERMINTVKWVVPGLLLFDGCRNRKRLIMVLGALCLLYILLAWQAVHYVPWKAIHEIGDSRTRLELSEYMGWHPAMLGKVFAGASWAALATILLAKRTWHRCMSVGMFLAISLGQIFVISRSGFVAWGGVGLTLCLLRWRRYLLLAPVVIIILVLAFPGASARLTSGFGGEKDLGQDIRDDFTITSGRNLIWPYVIEKIQEAPLIGHGRDAMRRTGMTETLRTFLGRGEAVSHAHNAYLDLMLESGLIGFLIIMAFFCFIVFHAAKLFRMRNSPVCAAIGGFTLAMVVGQLMAAIGSETFFPQEGDFGMWCAIGLLLRVVVERSRLMAQAAGTTTQTQQAELPVPVPSTG